MTEPSTGSAAPRRAPLSWIPVFIGELATGGTVRGAVRAAGIASQTAYLARERHPDFAAEWARAQAAGETARRNEGRVQAICAAGITPPLPQSAPPRKPKRARSTQWRPGFFAALAETSNTAIAAARANVTVATIYKLRREDAEFAGKWQAALHEGYDSLEMELLGHLRNPQPGRRIDVASALRLLAAHRETVERRRLLDEEDDEQALLESIDRFIDDMRERRAANTAVLRLAETGDGAE